MLRSNGKAAVRRHCSFDSVESVEALPKGIRSGAARKRRSSSTLGRNASFDSTDETILAALPSNVSSSSSSPRRHSRTAIRFGSSSSDGHSVTTGNSQAVDKRPNLLKRKHELKKKHKKRQRRIQLLLCVYITAVAVYLIVAFYRLNKLQSQQQELGQDNATQTINDKTWSLQKTLTAFWRRNQRDSKETDSARQETQVKAATNQHHYDFPPKYPVAHNFHADAVKVSDDVIDMCTNALWHTVETTTIVLPDGESFVHTGDIDDLWLRDSAAQVHPLLVPLRGSDFGSREALIAQDPQLDRIVAGLIKRSAMYIRHDPYANAFRIDDTYKFNAEQKRMGRHDLISTWNYELDSACYYLRMLYFYWKQSPNGDSPSSVLRLQRVHEAIDIMVDLWIAEQKHEDDSFPVGPLFDCLNCKKPYRYPGLPRQGKGSRTNSTAGLTWTGFRPSDDECKYGYLVPANMFAVVALGYAAEMATALWNDPNLAEKATRLAREIDRGIQEHAVVEHPEFGQIYAYEVDGYGNYFLMDDANIPSLMSIPYLDYKYDPVVYANTRRFIMSPSNPEYRKGRNDLTGEIEGYGSPHMSARIRNNIWPMSIAMQALTSDSAQEKAKLAEQLFAASAGTGWMHESFDVSNPKQFTRSWFCWADSLYAELVLSLSNDCPRPTRKYKVMEWRDPEGPPPGGPYAVRQ